MNRKRHTKINFIIAILATCIVFAALFVFVKGKAFERYYVNRKIAAMQEAYRKINAAFNEGTIESEEFDLAFQSIVEKDNVNIIILDTETDTIKASSNNSDRMTRSLLGYLFNQSLTSRDDLLTAEEKYEIHLAIDSRNNDEYLDMWGILDNGDIFLIRSPMRSIREATRIASNFFSYLILFLGVTFIACIIIYGRHIKIIELQTKNSELLRDIRQKEENEKMRSEFLSGVSHELKTPIAIIQGYAEGLTECVNQDEESRDYYCEVIIDEAKKMNDMVQKLLDINHLEFGDVIFESTPIDIIELIHNYLKSVSILLENGDVRVEMDDYPPTYIYSDEYYVREILNNYFTNALHHVNEEKIIRICVREEKDSVCISVFNSGEPIPEESLPRLFEKFYKVDKARTREYGGSGVGLSIVKAIMERMGEEYGVKNFTDGVEFYFCLKKYDSVLH